MSDAALPHAVFHDLHHLLRVHGLGQVSAFLGSQREGDLALAWQVLTDELVPGQKLVEVIPDLTPARYVALTDAALQWCALRARGVTNG